MAKAEEASRVVQWICRRRGCEGDREAVVGQESEVRPVKVVVGVVWWILGLSHREKLTSGAFEISEKCVGCLVRLLTKHS